MRGKTCDTNIDHIIRITERKDQMKSNFIDAFKKSETKPFVQDIIDSNELTTYLITALPKIQFMDQNFLYRLYDAFFIRKTNGWLVTASSIDLFFASVLNHLDD